MIKTKMASYSLFSTRFFPYYYFPIIIFIFLCFLISHSIANLVNGNSCKEFCINGNCDQNEQHCVCQPCWKGFQCNQFVNLHKAYFKQKTVKLFVKSETLRKLHKPIYTAKAFDQDLFETCYGNERNCSCALIRYRIETTATSENELYSNLFNIDPISGEIFIMKPQEVEFEKEYKLVVWASNPHDSNNDNDDSMTILIKVQYDLTRIRRQAPEDELKGMTFGLRTLGGDANSMQVGSSIHYKLEISLPKGPSDLVLEIRTLDSPMSNRTSLSLYNFSMPYETTGIQFNLPEPQFHLSTKTPNVFDRLTLDFGTIKNNGEKGNTLTICFSVVLIRKPKKSKKKHTLEVGVEFSKGTLTYVAQSEITTGSLNSKDDQVFCEVQMIESPEKIALDSAVTFRFDANLQFRSDPLKIMLNKTSYEYEPDNIISLGMIRPLKFGRGFIAIPQSPSHYVGFRNMILSKTSFSESILDMNTITNNGEKGRTFLRHPDNVITFIFSVSALNFKENIGKNVSFQMELFIGKKSFFNRIFNMTIVERNDNERLNSFLLESNGYFNNQNIPRGGITQLKVNSKFKQFQERTVFTDYSVVVDGVDTSKLSLIPCAARLVNEESGPNLPYLDPISIKPQREEDKFVFRFGRLTFVKLMDTSFNEEDNNLALEITFRVPFDSTLQSDDPLQANVAINSGYKTLPVIIENNTVTVFNNNEDNAAQSSIEMKTSSSVKWNDMIIDGGLAMDIELEFQPNTAYNDLRISIMKDNQNQLPDLNICRFSVVKVSNDMPCTCVEKETINHEHILYHKSRQSLSFYDEAIIDFGAVSIINGSEPSQKILTNFALMLNKKVESEEQAYPVKIQVFSNKNELMTSEVIILNISDTLPNTLEEMKIELDAELIDKDSIPVIPGFTTNILIKTLTIANTMGPFTLEVYSEQEDENNNTMVSICGLWVQRVGYNLHCVDPNKTAIYDFVKYGHNRKAMLHFDMITNFGNHIRKSAEDERLDNTLEFVSMVRISDKTMLDQTLKIKLNYGQKNITIIKDLIIPVDKSGSAAIKKYGKPKVSLKTYEQNNHFIHPGVPKLLTFDIELQNNSQSQLSIMMDQSNSYKICSASIIKIGQNYPCYSPFSLDVKPHQFELGMICNTYLSKEDPQDNILRLAFSLRPSEHVPATMPIQVGGLVHVGQIPLDQKNEITLTVDTNNADRFQIDKGATVEAESNDNNIVFKIRERKWIPFNIYIPVFSTGKLTIVAKGDSDENRAFIVLYDLRIVHGGQNIPCPFDNIPKLQLNSTIPHSSNQMNMITADLGWFSNFGYTYFINDKNTKNPTNTVDNLEDDLLKIEVLAELTDHPLLSEENIYKLTMETRFGNSSAHHSISSEAVAQIKLFSMEDPNPKLDCNIKYKKRMPVLDRNETFTLTATIKHLPESNAEPYNPALRIFTPNFVEIININWANTKELPILNKIDEGSTDIMFPWILFNEEFVVNFTVQIDPNNIRGYGRKEVSIITPYRMMCQHVRNVNVNSKVPCSQMKHINYRTESSECNIPLGMESGHIKDEQISASSTIGKRFAPHMARPSNKMESFWSPSVRNWKTEHYLQIDFLKKTRLVRVEFKSIQNSKTSTTGTSPTVDMRKVSWYHVNYSHDGIVWYQGTNSSRAAGYNGNDDLEESFIEKPIEARFVRLVIDSVTGRSSGSSKKESKNQYIAVKLELYGCYLDDPKDSGSSGAIIQSSPRMMDLNTHYTDDMEAKNRHISIDPYTNVIYFCDATSNDNQYLCYYSDTGGNSWNVIGRSIDSFEGFELATGKFYAIDYDRPAYFYTSDGQNYIPIDYEQFNITVSHTKFQRKQIIPRLNKQDVDTMNVRLGNWKADYDGLKYEESQYPKALWSKCCSVE